MQLTLGEMSSALGARLPEGFDPDQEFTCVDADSRKVRSGCLFACIPGERFDGHSFAAKALEQGAEGILAARELDNEIAGQVPVLVVPDVVKGLAALANAWRIKSGCKFIAVTGSAGKTTLKEMLASILSLLAPTAKNYLNLNNHIGLPLSMLEAKAEDRFWVMELGISKPGEMRVLAGMAEPDLAVIHNIGPAHLEGLGDLSGVAKEKTVLLRHVRPGGSALVSQDYPLLWQQARRIFPKVTGFSLSGLAAPFTAEYQPLPQGAGFRLKLDLQGVRFTLELPWCGAHLAENALAAAAAARLCGASCDEIGEGLLATRLPAQRFCATNCGALTLVDDTYNANPLSMRRSIEAARELAGRGPLVLVLGQMFELGRDSARRHEELGKFIAQTGSEAVFFRGEAGEEIGRGLSGAGFSGSFECLSSPEDFVSGFAKLGLEAATVLFKGSRSARMEEFLAALRGFKEGGE